MSDESTVELAIEFDSTTLDQVDRLAETVYDRPREEVMVRLLDSWLDRQPQ